jgi:putative endonuclease
MKVNNSPYVTESVDDKTYEFIRYKPVVVALARTRCWEPLFGAGPDLDHVIEDIRGRLPSYAHHYPPCRLVWYEYHQNVRDAMLRLLEIRAFPRAWRMQLVESLNPQWYQLDAMMIGFPGGPRRVLEDWPIPGLDWEARRVDDDSDEAAARAAASDNGIVYDKKRVAALKKVADSGELKPKADLHVSLAMLKNKKRMASLRIELREDLPGTLILATARDRPLIVAADDQPLSDCLGKTVRASMKLEKGQLPARPVYIEYFASHDQARKRRSELLKMPREWLTRMIEQANPLWLDLYEAHRGYPLDGPTMVPQTWPLPKRDWSTD